MMFDVPSIVYDISSLIRCPCISPCTACLMFCSSHPTSHILHTTLGLVLDRFCVSLPPERRDVLQPLGVGLQARQGCACDENRQAPPCIQGGPHHPAAAGQARVSSNIGTTHIYHSTIITHHISHSNHKWCASFRFFLPSSLPC